MFSTQRRLLMCEHLHAWSLVQPYKLVSVLLYMRCVPECKQKMDEGFSLLKQGHEKAKLAPYLAIG
jgi:hypothetical protein